MRLREIPIGILSAPQPLSLPQANRQELGRGPGDMPKLGLDRSCSPIRFPRCDGDIGQKGFGSMRPNNPIGPVWR